MNEPKKVAGFVICRRCDECGCRIVNSQETEYGALLRCVCGKEYRFFSEITNAAKAA